MARFFFHVESNHDQEGFELSSIADAKREAAIYAGRLLADTADTFWPNAELTVSVADETGLTLFTIAVNGTDAPVIRAIPKISI